MTIVYYHIPTKRIQKAPNTVRLHTRELSKDYKFHIHAKRYEIASLPEKEEEISKWLIDRYVEKDGLLERMKESWTDGLETEV